MKYLDAVLIHLPKKLSNFTNNCALIRLARGTSSGFSANISCMGRKGILFCYFSQCTCTVVLELLPLSVPVTHGRVRVLQFYDPMIVKSQMFVCMLFCQHLVMVFSDISNDSKFCIMYIRMFKIRMVVSSSFIGFSDTKDRPRSEYWDVFDQLRRQITFLQS